MAIRKRKHCGNHLSVIPIMLVQAKILERGDKKKNVLSPGKKELPY